MQWLHHKHDISYSHHGNTRWGPHCYVDVAAGAGADVDGAGNGMSYA